MYTFQVLSKTNVNDIQMHSCEFSDLYDYSKLNGKPYIPILSIALLYITAEKWYSKLLCHFLISPMTKGDIVAPYFHKKTDRK